MERVAVSFCRPWSLKPLDVSNAPASRGLQPTTNTSLSLPLENPQARPACLPACLFKKTALSVSFVACRSPGGYPMHRDSFCDEIAALLSHKTCTTSTDKYDSERPSCWPKKQTTTGASRAGHRGPGSAAQRMHSRTPNLRSFSQSLGLSLSSSPMMLLQGTHRRRTTGVQARQI